MKKMKGKNLRKKSNKGKRKTISSANRIHSCDQNI